MLRVQRCSQQWGKSPSRPRLAGACDRQRLSSPTFSALITASTRLPAPSLLNTWPRWLRTVLGLMPSLPAICLSDRPAATLMSTSSSRWERWNGLTDQAMKAVANGMSPSRASLPQTSGRRIRPRRRFDPWKFRVPTASPSLNPARNVCQGVPTALENTSLFVPGPSARDFFRPAAALQKTKKGRRPCDSLDVAIGCGGRIRTDDLRVMSRLEGAAESDVPWQLYSKPSPAVVACCAFRRLQMDCGAHSMRSETAGASSQTRF